jgi:hypothetical protein
MFDNLWLYVCAAIGLLYLAGPIMVRSGYHFAAKCNPMDIPQSDLPEPVSGHITPRIAEMKRLGFALVDCYDCGELAVQTRSYVAYFCNRTDNDFANVTATVSPRGVTSYFEFSTRFSNGQSIETNTNGMLPLTPGNPVMRVFRFADIQEPKDLYEIHRQLLGKYAVGLYPQAEPKGQEMKRWVRTVENYGPRHEKLGYMFLAEDGASYRLTWKGAFFVAWRGLWPTSLLRRMHERHVMTTERRELEHREVAALQKA